jgi:hypothetical protein
MALTPDQITKALNEGFLFSGPTAAEFKEMGERSSEESIATTDPDWRQTLTQRLNQPLLFTCDYDTDCPEMVVIIVRGMRYCRNHGPNGNHIAANDCRPVHAPYPPAREVRGS